MMQVFRVGGFFCVFVRTFCEHTSRGVISRCPLVCYGDPVSFLSTLVAKPMDKTVGSILLSSDTTHVQLIIYDLVVCYQKSKGCYLNSRRLDIQR